MLCMCTCSLDYAVQLLNIEFEPPSFVVHLHSQYYRLYICIFIYFKKKSIISQICYKTTTTTTNITNKASIEPLVSSWATTLSASNDSRRQRRAFFHATFGVIFLSLEQETSYSLILFYICLLQQLPCEMAVVVIIITIVVVAAVAAATVILNSSFIPHSKLFHRQICVVIVALHQWAHLLLLRRLSFLRLLSSLVHYSLYTF